MSTTPEYTDCPFCLSNNLFKGEIIAQSDAAYLTRNNFAPGCYLVIPTMHVESLLELPDNWWQGVKAVLATLPELPASYNLSLNVGKEAGQSIKHLHFWIIPRAVSRPSSGKGLARLIQEADQR